MSVDQEETGNTRLRVGDPVTNGQAPDPYPTANGHLVDPGEAAPVGEELAVSELGVAAQQARLALAAGLERLVREKATPWPVWQGDPHPVV